VIRFVDRYCIHCGSPVNTDGKARGPIEPARRWIWETAGRWHVADRLGYQATLGTREQAVAWAQKSGCVDIVFESPPKHVPGWGR
jgi:hypothetical protein